MHTHIPQNSAAGTETQTTFLSMVLVAGLSNSASPLTSAPLSPVSRPLHKHSKSQNGFETQITLLSMVLVAGPSSSE